MDYVLGTANLGLPYGKALVRELPDEAQVMSILDCARSLGVSWLDTAAAYGEAEARIGRYFARTPGQAPFRISSKLPPTFDEGMEMPAIRVEDCVRRLEHQFGVRPLDQFLIHRWTQYHAVEGRIWAVLRTLRESGHIARLGASVQGPAEAEATLVAPEVETIQLACNILDWRYETQALSDRLEQHTARIEVRSVFLQGLLTLAEGVRFPKTADPYDIEAIRDFLITSASELTGGDLVALCLRYATSLKWADALVFGVDSSYQLEEVMAALEAGPFSADVMNWLRTRRPCVPASLLDPAQWR